MIRLVAALLLVFFGTVHTWAGGDDGLFARPLFSSQYVVFGHAGLSAPVHMAPANKEAVLQGAGKCCPDSLVLVVSSLANCMFANVISVSSDAPLCLAPASPSAIYQGKLSGLDEMGNIFRPPII